MANFEYAPVHDIMVWGGVHGKRRVLRGRFAKTPRGEGGPGIPLVRSLHKKPILTENGLVEAGIANPEAVKRGVRYIDENLVFPLGKPTSSAKTYEGKLAPSILERSRNRDLVIDMHEYSGDTDDVVYVGSLVSPVALGFASEIGINTFMVGDAGIYNQIPEAVLVDVSRTSKRNDVAYWRSQLETTLREGLHTPTVEQFTIFALTDLTDLEHQQLGLNRRRHTPFEEIKGADDLLGVNRPVYTWSPQGFEVVVQLGVHDVSMVGDLLSLPTLRSLSMFQ